jgi:hypothetical protein
MAQTVGQHGLASFSNPENGDALDATVVRANDNTTRDAYVNHDSDGGIHLQSSLLAARPVAGTVGRKWLTTDTGAVRLWFDNGSAWEEIAYFTASGGTIAGNTSITGTLGVTGLITATGGVAGALTGNASTATTLQTARSINTVSFNGSADITVTASAATLTGTTLNSSVVSSSLTSVGTLTALTVSGAAALNSTATVGSTLTLQQALEKATISATAATGTINYDALTQAVLYYTSDASANWTLNIRGSSGVALSTMMAVGQSLTVVFLVTNGATPYYPSVHQIDGSTVTPKWLSGTAVISGNASAIDVYTYTVVRASGGFTLLASRSYYK